MKRRMRAIEFRLALAISILTVSTCSIAFGAQPSGYTLQDLQARLFYTSNGRLSSNVLTSPPTVLKNGTGPDGSFQGMLLVARVKGPAKTSSAGLALRVVATTKEDTLLDESAEIDEMYGNGNSYAAFWVDVDPCEPLTIAAWLVFDGPGPVRRERIEFMCTE
jgi:hypothetical protein